MRRDVGQLSLADGLVEGGAGRSRQLERIAALVDWAAFERLVGEIYAAPVGRPSYGPVVLMKCLLLQQWYRLSDPGREEAPSDRLSCRRCGGLARADPVPEHAILSRFRTELSRRGLAERLLAELNRQLDAKGLMVKAGTLSDASLVAADCRRPRKGEPVEHRSDRDASWTPCRRAPVRLQDAPRAGPRLGPGAAGAPHARPRLGQAAVPGPGPGRRTGGIRGQGLRRLVVSPRAGPAHHRRRHHGPATTGSGRAMPPATPATGCSGRSGGPSSARSAC